MKLQSNLFESIYSFLTFFTSKIVIRVEKRELLQSADAQITPLQFEI